MAGFSVGGLATGIDTASLISQLMVLERQPEVLLKKKQSTMQSKISILQQISASLSSLKTLAAGMNTASGIIARKATVGDSSALTATPSSSAMAGSHTISVTTLAASQRQVTDQGYLSSGDMNFRTGTITITGGDEPVTVTIAEGDNSLSGIAAAINDSDANVTASIMNDGSGTPYRLVVNGKDTKNYTLDFSGLTTDPAEPNGSVYDNPTITQSGAAYQAATQATFTVNGLPVTKDSNSVTDVIPGVTLNLLKEGVSTTVSITNDNDSVTEKITSFVNSYNDVISLINKQSEYNTSTKKGGVLSGDSTVRTVKTQLQSIISSAVSGIDGAYSTLSQIGITSSQKDGTLTIDSSKLSEALSSNFDDVVKLFTLNSETSGLSSREYGIAEQFDQVIEKLTHAYEGPTSSSNGLISSRIKGLNNSVEDINAQIEAMEIRMTMKQEALQKQFTAMEMMVSSLTSQGTTLLNYLSNL